MERATLLLRLLAVVIAGFAATALVATTPMLVPPKPISSPGQVAIPDTVRSVLESSCTDCHSSHTRWPWYAHLPPVSWVITRDVEQGRRAMNLEELSATDNRHTQRTIGALTAICAAVETRNMPPRGYSFMHPDAQLTTRDVSALCSWTVTETKRLHTKVLASRTPAAQHPADETPTGSKNP